MSSGPRKAVPRTHKDTEAAGSGVEPLGSEASDGQTADTPAISSPLHSDGVVCRCAVHWRREAIRRGLASTRASDGR